MKVRDFILVSRPANGELDVPLVFELDDVERCVIGDWLESRLGIFPGSLEFAAYRLAERGFPQAITWLVQDELSRRGGETEAVMIEPFPCPRSKVVW